MSPEETAAKVLHDYCYSPYSLQECIAQAIREERERCAGIAESFIPSGFTSDGKAGDTYAIARDDRARTIANAIRQD